MIPSALQQWIKTEADLEPRRLWDLYKRACGKSLGSAFRLALEAEGLGEHLDKASHEASRRLKRSKYVAEGAEQKPGTLEFRLKHKEWRTSAGVAFCRHAVELDNESAYNHQRTQKPAEGGLMVRLYRKG